MADEVKILVVETNGVEEEEHCERLLEASIVRLVPTADGFDNVDDWIRNFAGGDSCVGGAGANLVFLPGEVVGGCDASGN